MYLLNIVLYLFKANNNDSSTGSVHVVLVGLRLALVTLNTMFCTIIRCFFRNFECVYFYYIKTPKAKILKFLCQYIVLTWCVKSPVYSYFFNTYNPFFNFFSKQPDHRLRQQTLRMAASVLLSNVFTQTCLLRAAY